MHQPYRPTEIVRATLTQEFTYLLRADDEAPTGSWRKVTIITPGSGLALFALDVRPEALGPNRAYKAPEFAPNATVCFSLLPGQTLIGASDEGLVYATIIVEHCR